MRRRRQRNPILMRILGISVLVHIVALPVLAHFGAFKKIQQHFMEARLMTLPPPAPEKEKPEVHKVANKEHKTTVAKKSASSAPHLRVAARTAPSSLPPVVAGNGTGSDDGGTINTNGTGKVGEIPTPATTTAKNTGEKEATAPAPQPKETTNTTKPTPVKPTIEPKPVKPVEMPKPEPAVPKEPVFTEAIPLEGHQPEPTIPDDLRADALDKTFVADVALSAEGMPTEVKTSQSTGNDELDRLALATARQWRFKPATRDGQPIESRVRLHIEFQVN